MHSFDAPCPTVCCPNALGKMILYVGISRPIVLKVLRPGNIVKGTDFGSSCTLFDVGTLNKFEFHLIRNRCSYFERRLPVSVPFGKSSHNRSVFPLL